MLCIFVYLIKKNRVNYFLNIFLILKKPQYRIFCNKNKLKLKFKNLDKKSILPIF